MDYENPLDFHLEKNKRMPHGLRDSVTTVADVLDLSWLAAQSVFKERATPEIALQIYDRLFSVWQQHPSFDLAPQWQGEKEDE